MPDSPASAASATRLTRMQKGLFVLLAVSLISLLTCLYSSGWILFIISLIGWLCALTATILRAAYVNRDRNDALGRFGLLLAVLVLALQTTLAYQLSGFRLHVIYRYTSAANLSGMGMGLREYTNTNNNYPSTFNELRRSSLCSPQSFISVLDPGTNLSYRSFDWYEVIYSSYVYQPGKGKWANDAKIVLAYEYGAWEPIHLQLFPTYGQYVLFGDGRIELLEGEDFAKALQDDAQRRHEIGWPTDKIRPINEILSTKPATTQAASTTSP